MGLSGDVSYGRKKRQVLFIEKETLDEFGLSPGQVRENVTTSRHHPGRVAGWRQFCGRRSLV